MECQDLTSIAKLLIIQRSDIQLASLGLDLLSLSADLGSEDAALILVDISIERRSTMEIGTLRYQKALAHVKKLAIEKKNLQAYVVLGKVYEQAQQYEDAISMYKIAMDAHERGEIEEEDRTALAEAFRNAGQLFSIAPGMEDMAFKCFKTAARVYDDARSFYSMALISGEKSQDYVSLLSQAAISGVTEATYKLGIWYSTKGDYFDSGPRADATYTVACYWFELSKDLPALTARVTLHIARIERARVRMTEPRTTSASIQRVPKHIDLEQIGRNLPNENWSTLNLNVNAVKLESEMTKSAD